MAVGISYMARAVELAAEGGDGNVVATAQALLARIIHYPVAPVASVVQPAFEVIYVNLRSRPDRLAHIEGQLRTAGLVGSRLEASTGADTPESYVSRTWDSTLNAAFDTKTRGHPRVAMSPGERGCAMSHRSLWEVSAARPDDAPPLLILEDDAVLAMGCAQLLPRIIRAMHATWVEPATRSLVLYLCADVAKWTGQLLEVEPDLGVRESAYQWQTAAYVLWPPAARVLLAGANPIDCPVDVYMARVTLTRAIRSFLTQPTLARQAAPFQNGDVLHSNFYQPHVHVDDQLRAALDANQASIDGAEAPPAPAASAMVVSTAPQASPAMPSSMPDVGMAQWCRPKAVPALPHAVLSNPTLSNPALPHAALPHAALPHGAVPMVESFATPPGLVLPTGRAGTPQPHIPHEPSRATPPSRCAIVATPTVAFTGSSATVPIPASFAPVAFDALVLHQCGLAGAPTSSPEGVACDAAGTIPVASAVFLQPHAVFTAAARLPGSAPPPSANAQCYSAGVVGEPQLPSLLPLAPAQDATVVATPPAARAIDEANPCASVAGAGAAASRPHETRERLRSGRRGLGAGG